MRTRLSLRSLAAAALTLAIAAVGLVGTSVTPASAGAVSTTRFLSIYAGTGSQGIATGGAATSSPLRYPTAMATDASGNLYISDTNGYQVVKVTPAGALSVFVGTGTYGEPVPGPAASSPIGSPTGLAFDSNGNLYVADADHAQVFKVTPGGTLSIFAGTGTAGPITEGPALASDFAYNLWGLAIDSNDNVYIADSNNHQVAKVTQGGTLSIFAGSGGVQNPVAGPARAADIIPLGLAFDSADNLYIAAPSNWYVFKVTPGGTLSFFTGTGDQGQSVEGPAVNSPVNYAYSVAVDSSDNVYISDSFNYRVTKVGTDGNLSFVAGTGNGDGATPTEGPALSSDFDASYGIAVDSTGNVFVADSYGHYVYKLTEVTGSTPDQIIGLSDIKGNTRATVRFTAPNDGGSAITRYEAKVNNRSWVTVPCFTEAGTTNCTVSGLTNYTDVAISMRAVNAFGAGTASSPIITRPRLSGPSLNRAGSSSPTIIQVGFSTRYIADTTAKGYTAYAYVPGTGTYVASCQARPTERACDIKGLTPGTRYDIRVVYYFSFNATPGIPRETLASNTRSVTTKR